MGRSLGEPDELPNQLSAVDQRVAQELRQRNNNLWRSNYHEASIYIEEGLNNDKFENHPKKRARKALVTAPLQQHASAQQQIGALCCLTANEEQQQQQQQQQQHRHHDHRAECHEDAEAKKHGFILGGQYTTIETYILVHNRYFYQLDLAASIVLLLLALVEPPAIDGYELNPKIHAAIEMFALGIIAIELLLKFRWMGPGRFFRHGRTVTKLIVLIAMNFEAIVIFLRHSIHARYSRALRPIFLIDNHYCHGLRRAVRQIFQSLPPIIDMFTLALFFMFVFSIFGFYLFAANNHYFSDMPATIGNLLILATTANLPDVMMPSYAMSRWSAVFFVLFVIIHLFLFTNLTMAAVYEIFTRKEKEKFHKLLLHRRKACQEAFKLLVSRKHPTRIQYRQFMGLMRYLNRKCSMFDAYLIFKALDTDKSGSISLEEFYQIYDFINLEWKLIYPHFKWYDNYPRWPRAFKRVLRLMERICTHRLFEWCIDLLIAGQALLQFIEATAFGETAIKISSPAQQPLLASFVSIQQSLSAGGAQATISQQSLDDIQPDRVSTHVFISIFVVEAALRCLASGPSEYWRNKWNRFDLLVLFVSLCGLFNGLLGGQPFGWVIVLRVLRLMRLFEFKRRYRDMWQTLTYILLKRFVSMTCVVMILYYFFAIIGMELLADYDLRNCCKNTTLESQFKFDPNSSTLDSSLIRYYLNDFGDIVASYLTLFSMSSNTYWLTLMSAYTLVSGSQWVRLFFGLYYVCSIIVMNIVIAFILESFLFHIHYRNKMGDNCDDTNLFTVSVTLSSFEVDFLRETLGSSAGPAGSGGGSGGGAHNGSQCVRELEETVAKMRRVNEERKFHSCSSSSSSFAARFSDSSLGAASLITTTKIIGDDYSEAPDERTCLLREPKAHKKRAALNGKSAGRSHAHAPQAPQSDGAIPLIEGIGSEQKGTDRNKPPGNRNNNYSDNGDDNDNANASSSPSAGAGKHSGSPPRAKATANANQNCPRRPEFYLIYQAEQIRNKFSFTMKMYADEVESWLAEAERADQDAMSLMISRNQLRAEHVAVARLARRSQLASATGSSFHLNHYHQQQQQQHYHHQTQHRASPMGGADDGAPTLRPDGAQLALADEGSPSAGPQLVAATLLGADWLRPRSYSTSAGSSKRESSGQD